MFAYLGDWQRDSRPQPLFHPVEPGRWRYAQCRSCRSKNSSPLHNNLGTEEWKLVYFFTSKEATGILNLTKEWVLKSFWSYGGGGGEGASLVMQKWLALYGTGCRNIQADIIFSSLL